MFATLNEAMEWLISLPKHLNIEIERWGGGTFPHPLFNVSVKDQHDDENRWQYHWRLESRNDDLMRAIWDIKQQYDDLDDDYKILDE